MSARGDDVSELFKSFGSEKKQFRELARSSDAAAAQARWPLFKMIQAEEEASVPPLSSLAKTRWQNEPRVAPTAAVSPAASSEPDLMAQSLRQLSRASAVQPLLKPEAASRPFPALQAQRREPAEPASHSAAPRPLFGRAVQEPQAPIKQPGMPGLFSKKTAAATNDQVSADHSLAGIFKRLEEGTAAAPARKLSFLRQPERR